MSKNNINTAPLLEKKSAWSWESISDYLKAKYYKNKKWGMYSAGVTQGSAFTVFFANMASAFLGPYELVLLLSLLGVEAFSLTQNSRRAFVKAMSDRLGLSEKAAQYAFMAQEFVLTAAVFTAIVGGNLLANTLIIGISPFIFVGVMGTRVLQNMYYVGKNLNAAYKAYQDYKKWDPNASFLSKITRSMGKRIGQFLGFGSKTALSHADDQERLLVNDTNNSTVSSNVTEPLSLKAQQKAAWEKVKAPLKAAAFNFWNATVFSLVSVGIAFGFGVVQAASAVVSSIVIAATTVLAINTVVTIARGPDEGKGVEVEMAALKKVEVNTNDSSNDQHFDKVIENTRTEVQNPAEVNSPLLKEPTSVATMSAIIPAAVSDAKNDRNQYQYQSLVSSSPSQAKSLVRSMSQGGLINSQEFIHTHSNNEEVIQATTTLGKVS